MWKINNNADSALPRVNGKKIKNGNGKKYLMVGDSILDKVPDKIKKLMDIEKFDDSKIMIETDDKLSDDIIWNNVVIDNRWW